MKKCIALILALTICFSVLGLSGCAEESGVITLYEFKDDYERGTPVKKTIFKERKITLSEGFVASNGQVFTQEKLSELRLITKDNWNDLISRDSVLAWNVKAGALLVANYVTEEPINESPIMVPFNQPIEP